MTGAANGDRSSLTGFFDSKGPNLSLANEVALDLSSPPAKGADSGSKLVPFARETSHTLVPFGKEILLAQAGPLPMADYEKQKAGGGVDAKNDKPGEPAPKYPGPAHDQDKWVMRRALIASPAASVLYEMYLRTYTDRSGENKVPEAIKIAELHKGIQERVKTVELVSDSELMRPDRMGVVLHPTGVKHPGAFYALLRDERGAPINIIQYVQPDGKSPQYLQQWIFDRSRDKDTGAQTTTITQFRESKQTNIGRPKEENGTMADVLVGKSEYVSDAGGSIVLATQYNNIGRPIVQVDMSGGSKIMRLSDPNTGKLKDYPYAKAHLSKMPYSHIYVP